MRILLRLLNFPDVITLGTTVTILLNLVLNLVCRSIANVVPSLGLYLGTIDICYLGELYSLVPNMVPDRGTSTYYVNSEGFEMLLSIHVQGRAIRNGYLVTQITVTLSIFNFST